MIEDFPDDAPQSEESAMGWACPISLTDEHGDLTDTEQLRLAFKREISRMRSWYDMGMRKSGRTTFGASGLDPGTVAAFVAGFLDGGAQQNPRDDIPLSLMLKLAVDDLKTYYMEAAAAEPGKSAPTSGALAHWFWNDTMGARVLRAVQEACVKGDDPMLKLTGERLIVPMDRS